STLMFVHSYFPPVLHPSPHASLLPSSSSLFFFFNAPPPTEIYTLSLHDALPICGPTQSHAEPPAARGGLITQQHGRIVQRDESRSEEHTSELQSRVDLVCRLLLEKKKKKAKKRCKEQQKNVNMRRRIEV